MMTFIPFVGIRDDTAHSNLDLVSRLLKDRAVLLTSDINDGLASLIVAQLLHLESEDAEKDIVMYINSPGGSVTAALAIYDVMAFVKPRVVTLCFGQACSGASLLLCAGQKRVITKHARVLIHQPIGGSQGQASDLKIYTEEIMRLKKTIVDIYARHTHMKRDDIERFIDRDCIMTPEEAVHRGIVDDIVQNRRNKLISVETKDKQAVI